MNRPYFAEQIATLLDEPQEKVVDVEEQAHLYTLGFHFYEGGDYQNAAQSFTKLILSNPFGEKYWRGLASSRQMQKDFLAAVHAWSIVVLLAENDPIPHFHAAECLLSLNEKEDAFKALNACCISCKL